MIAPRLPLLLLCTIRKKCLKPSSARDVSKEISDASPGSSVSLKAGRRAVGPGGGREDSGSSWKQSDDYVQCETENIVFFYSESSVYISQTSKTNIPTDVRISYSKNKNISWLELVHLKTKPATNIFFPHIFVQHD